MEFQRDIYKELTKWVKGTKGLLLKGTRQVGKTFILDKLANDLFNNVLYVNLGNLDTYEWFEDRTRKLVTGEDWVRVFFEFSEKESQKFSNSPDTLVILDEVQSSSRVFNGIRQIVRDCHCRVVATGSYLGIMDIENHYADNRQAFFYPAGDVEVLEMYPMTYLEVITACAQHGIVNMQRICNYYLRFGGFPEVVRNWIQTQEYSECISVLDNIFGILVRESQRYFHGAFPEKVWVDTLISVAKQIESKKSIPEGSELVYNFRSTDGIDVKRQETVDSMRWLLSCNLLLLGNVTNNLKQPEKKVKYSYYFVDQGLLFIILDRELRNRSPQIDKGNVPGLLAENFVALSIMEFDESPTTYSRSNPNEEIDFIAEHNGLLYALEVKYTRGVIKIQGFGEGSTENTTTLRLYDCHKLGTLLGEEYGKTKYDKTRLAF